MADRKDNHETDEAREARAALERVTRDAEVIGTSSFVRTADKVRGHMTAADADPNDKVEVWARRTARAASVIAFIGLALWLINFLAR